MQTGREPRGPAWPPCGAYKTITPAFYFFIFVVVFTSSVIVVVVFVAANGKVSGATRHSVCRSRLGTREKLFRFWFGPLYSAFGSVLRSLETFAI